MRKKSHILLARYLADQMPANISLQSHRKAFCLGNILPDIQPSFVTKRHEYFGTFDEVQEKIIQLVETGAEDLNDRVFCSDIRWAMCRALLITVGKTA